MLGHIEAIEIAFPPNIQSLEDVAQEVGLSRLDVRMFDRFYGLRRFHSGPGTLDDLLTPVVDQMQHNQPQAFAAISHVVHCHTVPCVRVFDTASLTPSWLGRFPCQTEFASLTMGHCATPLTAAEWLLRQLSPGAFGLMLIGEKAFHPRVKLIKDTTLMGEAACAVLLTVMVTVLPSSAAILGRMAASVSSKALMNMKHQILGNIMWILPASTCRRRSTRRGSPWTVSTG